MAPGPTGATSAGRRSRRRSSVRCSYATTYALLGSTLPLVPIQIGALLSGNVQAGQENVGQALGAGMLVVIAVVMVLYAVLQRRASRWLR